MSCESEIRQIHRVAYFATKSHDVVAYMSRLPKKRASIGYQSPPIAAVHRHTPPFTAVRRRFPPLATVRPP